MQNPKFRPSLVVLSSALFASAAFAQTSLDIHEPRGAATVNHGHGEICIVPKVMPGSKPQDMVNGNHIKLCSLDEYDDATIAICPKTHSTNPAVEFYQIPSGDNKARFESKECLVTEESRKGDKLAKLKSSVTCSYVPSQLGYDALGDYLDAAHVPASVIRTMDIATHQKMKAEALAGADRVATAPYWNSWNSKYANKSAAGTFTKDQSQIYGSLLENASGEEQYAAKYLAAVGPSYTQWAFFVGAGPAGFAGSQPYKMLMNPSSLDNTPKTLAGASQAIQSLKDAADLIVMDTILRQQDRFGNTHFKKYYHYVEAGAVKSIGFKKLTPDQAKAKGAVLTVEMILKDNDCGVQANKVNKMFQLGAYKTLRHFSPKTYKRLRALAAAIASSEQLHQHFQHELLFTTDDWKNFAENVTMIANSLHTRCASGELKLDLDIERFLGLQAPATCD